MGVVVMLGFFWVWIIFVVFFCFNVFINRGRVIFFLFKIKKFVLVFCILFGIDVVKGFFIVINLLWVLVFLMFFIMLFCWIIMLEMIIIFV